MSQPIVIPPQKSPEAKFAQALRDPAVRQRAARDPIFASRLMESFRKPMTSQGPNIDPYSQQNYILPPVSSFLSGSMGVAPRGTSVADQVRMQRDSFLVADGSQITGNYDTVMRAAKGGISAPRTPRVGSPSAFYPYPGDNMRTGAALAASPTGGGVAITATRGLLPTTGYNPGAFVATRPDSLNRSLMTNMPVRMPRETVAQVRREMARGIVTSSPSDERRKALSTLMGLGATPDPKGVDPRLKYDATVFSLLMDFLDNDEGFRKENALVANSLAAMFGFLVVPDEANMDAAQKAFWGYDGTANLWSTPENALRFAKKTLHVVLYSMARVVQVIITTLIMAEKFDLDALGIKQLLDQFDALKNAAKEYGGSYNALINAKLLDVYPEGWGEIIQALGGQMPFNLEITGVRKYLIAYLYRRVWSAEISADVYNAVSSKLACGSFMSASMTTALDTMLAPAYAPGKKPPPAVTKCKEAKKFEVKTTTGGGAGAGGEGAAGEANMTVVKGGLIAAAVLLGVGIYAKTR